MNKYERLLYILNLIRSHKGLNANDLADKCAVTERTIFRDITALSSANVPIYYDRGYKLLTGSFLPTLNFDLKEYLLAREALRTTPLKKFSEYSQTLKGIEAKIDACIAPHVIEEKKFAGTGEKLVLKERPVSDKETLWFGIIEQAISSNRVITMEYNSIDSGVSQRRVEPRFSICAEGKFYFVGYCLMRDANRTFRLSRIKSLTLGAERAKKRAALNPETYFENSWTVFGGDLYDIELEFSGRAARLVESSSYLKGELKEPLSGGRLSYKARVAGLTEIGRWVLGYGSEVKTIAPRELRDWILGQATGILERNK